MAWHDRKKMKQCSTAVRFFREKTGSVMMEYIVISMVLLLGTGGLVYADSKYTNLFFGPLPGEYHSPLVLQFKGTTPDESLTLDAVDTMDAGDIKTYGMIGNAYSESAKNALKAVAAPLL